jgi:L-amino acid N-acyltransferase YncA
MIFEMSDNNFKDDRLERDAIAIRLLAPEDAAAFARFVAGVPDGERRFLKEDVADPASTFAGYMHDTHARRVVAVAADGEIVGVAGAFPGTGWSSHVAELRVLVSASHRQQGTGRVLARAGLVEALKLGCSHVYVELIAEQEALVVMFQHMGFEPEALLRDFVRDGEGNFHDLMLLTHRVADHWGTSAVLGLEEVGA